MKSTSPKLYSYRRCPYAIRVRMALHEKAVEFETVEEDLKNKSEELLRLHPEGRVPLFIHNDLAIYESSVITEYVNEVFSGIDLMPTSASAKAEVRLWTVWCNHLLKPEIDRLKYEKDELIKSTSIIKLDTYFAKLEEALSNSDFLVKNSFSLADIHVFPFVRQTTLLQAPAISFTKYLKLNSWFERIGARPSFQKTMQK